MDKVVLPTNIYTQKCQLLNNIAIPISEDLTIEDDNVFLIARSFIFL